MKSVIMTLEELREYLENMPEDEILSLGFEDEEESHERDDKER